MGHAGHQYRHFAGAADDRRHSRARHDQDAAGNGDYRIDLMDRDDHVRSHRVIRCAHEEDALAEALHLLRDYPRVEVWNGARMVRRLTLPTHHAR